MRYGEKYILNKNSKIVIYGAATTGAILYHNLSNQGYDIVAFMDKRADEIDSYYDLPVWNFQEAEMYFETDNEIVVIIGIKNVFEHEKIARTLWGMKCNKIVFRPYNAVEGMGSIKDKELNKIYEQALHGSLSYCYIINDYEDISLKDNAIILENNEYVIANIPSQYVFTDNYKDKNILWGDIPCLGLIPHIGLFNLFLGKQNQDYKEYICFCREAALRSGGIVTSKAWEDSVFANRLDVFNHMQYAWEHDRSFFIKNTVEAVYNHKGYFNIKSGKHRIVYQLVKGSHYIPLKIQKSDYYIWRNEDIALKLKELLKEANNDSLPVIIGNPYYYNYPCNSSDFYKRILDEMILLIFREQYYKRKKFVFEGQKILFYNTPLALYADIFIMLGFDVFIFEQNDINKKMINMLTDGKCFHVDQMSNDTYTWAVIEGKDAAMNIKTEKTIRISNEENGQVLASGLANGEFISAFLKNYLND